MNVAVDTENSEDNNNSNFHYKVNVSKACRLNVLVLTAPTRVTADTEPEPCFPRTIRCGVGCGYLFEVRAIEGYSETWHVLPLWVAGFLLLSLGLSSPRKMKTV